MRKAVDVIAAADFLERADLGIVQALRASYHDGEGGAGTTAVRHWERYTIRGLHIAAVRVLDPNAPLSQRLGEEDLILRFVWWLVTQLGVAPETAQQYVSTIMGWHKRWYGVALAGGMKLERVPQVVKGLRQQLGPKAPKKERKGLRPKLLRRAIDEHLRVSKLSPALQANYEALLEVATVGLLRGGDVLTKQLLDEAIHCTRADAFFYSAGTPDQHSVVWARNSKARGPDRLQKLPVYMPSGGKYLDPDCALRRLFALDPVSKKDRESTPLFRDPATNKSLTVDQMRSMVQFLMQAIGLDGSKYGAHSARIGGATAMAWDGATELEIKTQGRWSSAVYLVYIRRSLSRSLTLSQRACSADVDDTAQCCLVLDDDGDEDDI